MRCEGEGAQDLKKDLDFGWKNAVFEYKTAGCRTLLKGKVNQNPSTLNALEGALFINVSDLTIKLPFTGFLIYQRQMLMKRIKKTALRYYPRAVEQFIA